MNRHGTVDGSLHDVVQQTVAILERSRESVEALLRLTGADGSGIHYATQSLQSSLAAVAAERDRCLQVRQEADAAFQAAIDATPIDRDQVSQCALSFAAAEAALATCEGRERSYRESIEAFAGYRSALDGAISQLAVATEQSGSAVGLLTHRFRELGTHLESAQQSRALGMHVIRAQEEERRRLAREIHDGPTQLLNSVVLRIDVCQRFFETDPSRVRDDLQQLKELVRLSLQDVRKIIFDLRPMALDDLGLVPALRGFVKDYQGKTGIEAEFIVFGKERRYDPALEIAAFRIVQEALTNALKHAGASRVWVQVEATGGRDLKVSVRDDGVGFDPARIGPSVGGSKFGLVAMRERAELLGGAMEIQSAPGQGSRLAFQFPLMD